MGPGFDDRYRKFEYIEAFASALPNVEMQKLPPVLELSVYLDGGGSQADRIRFSFLNGAVVAQLDAMNK